MLREDGGYSVGGAAETTNGVKTQHRLASVHMRRATTSHDTLPGIVRVFVFRARFVKYEAETRHQWLGKSTRTTGVCLSSHSGRKLKRPRSYAKPFPVWHSAKELIPHQTPHCYSLMMQRDRQRTHSQISSRPVWEMKRKGGLLCLHVCSFGRLS